MAQCRYDTNKAYYSASIGTLEVESALRVLMQICLPRNGEYAKIRSRAVATPKILGAGLISPYATLVMAGNNSRFAAIKKPLPKQDVSLRVSPSCLSTAIKSKASLAQRNLTR